MQNSIRKAIDRNQNPDANLCPNQKEFMNHIAYFFNCSLLIESPNKLKKN